MYIQTLVINALYECNVPVSSVGLVISMGLGEIVYGYHQHWLDRLLPQLAALSLIIPA